MAIVIPFPLHATRQPVPRYTLRAWAEGYLIEDRGEAVAIFHGPSIDLAAKTLRRLSDGEQILAEVTL